MTNVKHLFDKIGYANDTTCIRTNDLDLVEQAIIQIFQEEGYRSISKPVILCDSNKIIQELRSSSYKMNPYLWVVGLKAGNFGWTMIKSSVAELFCRKAKPKYNSRLSELAILTGCDVFHHSVHNRHWGVLVEVNNSGKTLATGCLDVYDMNNMQFYDIPVVNQTEKENFFLLNVPAKFNEAGKLQVHLNNEEKKKIENKIEADFQEQPQQLEIALKKWRKLNIGKRELIDEDLGLLLNNSHFNYYQENTNKINFWHEENILYKAYTQPGLFSQEKIRLLFIQISNFDCKVNVGEIWQPIIDFNWQNYFENMKKANLKRQ